MLPSDIIAPYFGIPYMRFGSKLASWKEIYECILSPLPNKYQTYIGHKRQQRKLEEVEAERKRKIGTSPG